jgi:hypothetical protein
MSMAPPDLVEALGPWGARGLQVLVGVAFGFVLERAGFADCRRLAAQFYLHEQRVLKVMFTAIVVAMLLLLWGGSLGLVELARLQVPSTYLGSALVGGLLLGAGFIVGGYCPGTSIVSAATLKADGALFLLGATVGVHLFGETVEAFGDFWRHAGARGVLTLPAWLGLPAGVVALGIVVLAIGMFAGAERLERAFAHLAPREPRDEGAP